MFLKLIDILEIVHEANLVYNDLKPDNIMVNRKTGEVTLIDFGFASSYLEPDGKHLSGEDLSDNFIGNI